MGDKATGAFATPLADEYEPKTGPDRLRPEVFPPAFHLPQLEVSFVGLLQDKLTMR
jgi:hypothetical protein